jgi:hypothetical protein
MEETVSEKKDIKSLQPGEALAYVDGSYNGDTGFYSCGVVFFCEGEELHFCKKGEEKELASMRNVAGEIMGAQMAMEEALRRGLLRGVPENGRQTKREPKHTRHTLIP